jgi:PAS domain S-box-containing protein
MKFRLSTKLTLSIILVIFIFGAIATTFVFFGVNNDISKRERSNLNDISTQINNILNQTMQQSSAVSETVASNPDTIKYLQNKIIYQEEHVLQHLNNINIGNIYSAIYIMLPNGETVVSTDPSFVRKNYGFRDYFKKAIIEDNYVDVALGVTSRQLGYYFSNAIKDKNGKILGVAVAKLKPEHINNQIKDITQGLNLTVIITDNFGVIIYSNEPENLYKSLGHLTEDQKTTIESKKKYEGLDIQPIQYNALQKIVNNQTKDIQLVDFFDEKENRQELISISRLKNYNFYTILKDDASKYITPALTSALTLGVFVLLAALFSTILISFLIKKFLEPLTYLENSTKEIARGNYSIKLKDIKSNDEIGNLTRAFNKMISAVQKSRKEIEEKVEAQTRQIKKTNDDLQKQQSAIINVLEDVQSEKDKAEEFAYDLEKFKLAVENTSDQVVITDKNGMVLYANKALERITGYKVKEAMGKKAGVLWGKLMETNYYKKMWDTILIKKKTFTSEIKNKRKDGKEYFAEVSISPILDRDKNVIFIAGIERDITEKILIDKAKTEFVSLASHQLRTPLSAIKWYNELINTEGTKNLNKKQKDYLKQIDQSNERMIGLVNSLLNVSRIEMGTFMVEPKLADIKEISNTILKENLHEIKNKKIKLIKKYDKNIPEINLDVKLTEMVLHNLVSNAIKYSKDKSKVLLTISKKGGNIEIVVKDNGCGIPIQQHSQIFNKLFRADNVARLNVEGTGLGLYIAKSIIDHVGGKIWFDSEENKGSTFYVTIPIKGMKRKKGTKQLSSKNL